MLVTFDSATPATAQSSVAVTGLSAGDTLVGIDFRGSNGLLYGVSTSNQLYTISPTTGAATAVNATAFTPVLDGSAFAVDFNPVADKLRVISDTNQNLRIDPATGNVAATDTSPAFDPTSYADYFTDTPPAPQIVAAAYTSNFDATANAPVTTLYGIDANLDALVTIGGADGSPSPNTGQVFITSILGLDASSQTAFDIQPTTDAAFLADGKDLYSLNLTTGATSKLGTVGTMSNLLDLAVAPPAAGTGMITLPATAFTFTAARTPVGVTVLRTAGATGTATVDFATSDGTAVAGVDYLPTNGTLTFAPGETTQTISLLLPNGVSPPSAAKSFNLTLSNPTGGITLGTPVTATVAIPAVTAPGTPTHYVAAASGGGSPMVVVYDPTTGAQVASFAAYEGSFSSGVNVATGDVNGDGIDDVIVGSGSGGGPRVRVFDGSTLTATTPTILADFFAYESTFRGGVNVAAGDINGDGFDDVIIGSGNGGGPRVRVFDGESITSASQTSLADFFAYEDSFRGGVNVGSGVFGTTSNAEIIAGAGIGGGPRVRIFDGSTFAPIADYFAYDPSFRNGVLVATGDVNNDGVIDVVTGAGVGGGPNVRSFSGITQTQIGSFFAYDQSLTGGVRVSTADFGADDTTDIVTGAGPGGPSTVNFFTAAGAKVFSFDAFPSTTGGVFVG